MTYLSTNGHEAKQPIAYGVWLILILVYIASGCFSVSKSILVNFNQIDLPILGYYLIMLTIGVLTIIGFFLRSAFTPKLMIAYLSINLLYFGAFSFLIWNSETGGIDYFGLIRVIVLCLLIIPYLLISKRVKEVFSKVKVH